MHTYLRHDGYRRVTWQRGCEGKASSGRCHSQLDTLLFLRKKPWCPLGQAAVMFRGLIASRLRMTRSTQLGELRGSPLALPPFDCEFTICGANGLTTFACLSRSEVPSGSLGSPTTLLVNSVLQELSTAEKQHHITMRDGKAQQFWQAIQTMLQDGGRSRTHGE